MLRSRCEYGTVENSEKSSVDQKFQSWFCRNEEKWGNHDGFKLGSPTEGWKMKDMAGKNNLMDKIESAFCRIERLHKIKALETIINMAERGEEISSNTVAAECIMTPRQARYWLKFLEELGYLIGSKKTGTKGGLFVYQLSEKAKAQTDKIRTSMIRRKVFLEKTRNSKGKLEDER